MQHGKASLYGPPPHWYSTIAAGDRAHCPPWELDPDDVPRLTWRERILMLMECEAEIARSDAQREKSRERINRVRSGRGRFQGGRH